MKQYSQDQTRFHAAPFIREIGRGKKGARDLSRNDAQAIYAAMLNGQMSEIELGGFLIAMRIKGESVQELAGFLHAAEASFTPLIAPEGSYAPVVIPSYNGARQLPNLTPLLACLLAREGVPVLVHGMTHDPGRVTTAEIFAEMDVQECIDAHAVAEKFTQQQPAFIAIQNLAPGLYQLLQVRRVLGLRNSTHMLVKIMQPFTGKALRLVSYTHPEYFTMLCDYFSTASNPEQGDVFLMRGTEGETVANAKRANAIEWFHQHQRSTLVERQEPVDHFPDLPANDAATTAAWIKQALLNEELIPFAIKEQVAQCKQIARQLKT